MSFRERSTASYKHVYDGGRLNRPIVQDPSNSVESVQALDAVSTASPRSIMAAI